MKTAIDWLLNNLPLRYRNAMLNTCQEEINQARQKEREQMIDFYTWMRRNDSAEEFFHYTDEDMLEQYLNGDYGPGWRDLSEPLEVSTQDPATVIEYTPKGNSTIEELYKRYKAMEVDNKELEEYKRMLYEGNKQYFHGEIDKEIENIEIRLLGKGREVLSTAEFSYDTYSDLKTSDHRDISSEILTILIDEYKEPKIIK